MKLRHFADLHNGRWLAVGEWEKEFQTLREIQEFCFDADVTILPGQKCLTMRHVSSWGNVTELTSDQPISIAKVIAARSCNIGQTFLMYTYLLRSFYQEVKR